MFLNILLAIFIGGISGYTASFIMNNNNSIIKNIAIGIAGGIVGDLILSIFNISFGGYLKDIIVSVFGSCLLIFIINKFFK
ncbi:MAG: GlsB/YeaQ/YmgE family stress response membrane protein [Bacilli bacterium]|nr:GlsB/YeaQ/YmgE family stress response membrane protein [Bacilli bacterium]